MKIKESKENGIITYRLDDMPEDKKEELLNDFTKQTGLTRSKGRIKPAARSRKKNRKKG